MLINVPPVNATTDGVVLAPSAFSMTLACLPSMTATQELVVPRSMPTTWPVTPLPPDFHRRPLTDEEEDEARSYLEARIWAPKGEV